MCTKKLYWPAAELIGFTSGPFFCFLKNTVRRAHESIKWHRQLFCHGRAALSHNQFQIETKQYW
jgi:hypothetical protein